LIGMDSTARRRSARLIGKTAICPRRSLTTIGMALSCCLYRTRWCIQYREERSVHALIDTGPAGALMRAEERSISHLFTPVAIGGITLANRIAVSPMCQYSAENGAANDWHLQHLGSLSLSGAALVVVEQTAVEAAGRISHGCLGLYSDATEAALARVVGFCRRAGSAAGIKSTKRSKAEGRCHAYARSTNQAATRF
jgi:NADH:flavin oxidoreductase / NADH oxidase family